MTSYGAAQQAVEADGRTSGLALASCLSPMVEYHGLGRGYWLPQGFLVRPLLNGDTLAGPDGVIPHFEGFVKGSESSEPAYFGYSAGLRIFADNLDLDEITRALGIQPTATHRRGDRKGPRSPPYRHDMWQLSSGLPEEKPLGEHIDFLWSQVREHEDYLRRLKTVASVDVFLGYRSNVDTAGVEIPHASLEMFVRLEIPLGISIIIA